MHTDPAPIGPTSAHAPRKVLQAAAARTMESLLAQAKRLKSVPDTSIDDVPAGIIVTRRRDPLAPGIGDFGYQNDEM